jgi:hypothetical protein
MKIIKDNWLDYKEGRRGSEVIKMFEDFISNEEFDVDAAAALLKRFNPDFANSCDEETLKELLNLHYQNILDVMDYLEKQHVEGEPELTIGDLMDFLFNPESWQGGARQLLGCVPFISFALFYQYPEVYFPYMFTMDILKLRKFAERYDIELPEMPLKSDYEGRSWYYRAINDIVYDFREENEWSESEMCAFLYDYAQRENEREPEPMPSPARAWFAGGVSNPYERSLDYRFWQANPDVRRGDILVHYENTPVSAITGIWIAQEDGITDPYFPYYSYTYQGGHIATPHITLADLKADEYFKDHALVRKNMQGVSRWPMTGEDYNNLLRMFEAKGFDTTALPHLYAPQIDLGVSIKRESDVTKYLIKPMLTKMGWEEDKDYKLEVEFRAGRGSAKRPDYCLHLGTKNGDMTARVIIEAKYLMKTEQDIIKAFDQCRSYGKWGDADTLVVADKQMIRVYQKKKGYFDSTHYTQFYWADVLGGANPDAFNQLRTLIS